MSTLLAFPFLIPKIYDFVLLFFPQYVDKCAVDASLPLKIPSSLFWIVAIHNHVNILIQFLITLQSRYDQHHCTLIEMVCLELFYLWPQYEHCVTR